jgi:hypothetical protein
MASRTSEDPEYKLLRVLTYNELLFVLAQIWKKKK